MQHTKMHAKDIVIVPPFCNRLIFPLGDGQVVGGRVGVEQGSNVSHHVPHGLGDSGQHRGQVNIVVHTITAPDRGIVSSGVS